MHSFTFTCIFRWQSLQSIWNTTGAKVWTAHLLAIPSVHLLLAILRSSVPWCQRHAKTFVYISIWISNVQWHGFFRELTPPTGDNRPYLYSVFPPVWAPILLYCQPFYLLSLVSIVALFVIKLCFHFYFCFKEINVWKDFLSFEVLRSDFLQRIGLSLLWVLRPEALQNVGSSETLGWH